METKHKKPKNYKELLVKIREVLGEEVPAEDICFIGDRIYSDVQVAKRAGAFSIKVDPFPQSVLNFKMKCGLFLEKPMFWHAQRLYKKDESTLHNSVEILKSKLFVD